MRVCVCECIYVHIRINTQLHIQMQFPVNFEYKLHKSPLGFQCNHSKQMFLSVSSVYCSPYILTISGDFPPFDL